MTITEQIKKYDEQNQFKVIAESYKQIEYVINNKFDLTNLKNKNFSNIVVNGLGGSAIGGALIQNFFGTEMTVPYHVNRNYALPFYADENTLVVSFSYSGNTEETLSATEQALRKGCSVICVTSGGKLEEIAKENSLSIVKLQSGFQPRFALWGNFFSLVKIFETLELISEQKEFFEQSLELLKNKGETLSAEENPALNYAQELLGYVPVIYSAADYTSALGERLKGEFNENSKLHAFFNVLPEMNHNEIIGWETFSEKLINAKAIFILDQIYHNKILKRFEISGGLIEKAGAEIIRLESSEENYKLRYVDLIYLGDWISYYLAILRKKDPSEIDNIYYLKDKLAEGNGK